MKLEDVKKLLHDDIVFKISTDSKTVQFTRAKDMKPIATMHFWKGVNSGVTEARCVLDGYASLDDIASTVSCLFINLLYHNSNLNQTVIGMVER